MMVMDFNFSSFILFSLLASVKFVFFLCFFWLLGTYQFDIKKSWKQFGFYIVQCYVSERWNWISLIDLFCFEIYHRLVAS
jgi:hypothetical protein